MKIKDICIDENKSIKEAMKNIDQSGLGIAFVINDEKKFVGVVSDGNIRRAILKGIDLGEPVKKVTNTSPIVANEDWDENEIKNLFKKKEFHKKLPRHGTIRIPVLDEKNQIIDFLFASEKNCLSFIKSIHKSSENSKEIAPVQRILVVGGAGYLGSVLCRKLLSKGYMLRVLDNLTYGDHGVKDLYDQPNFEFIKGDMRDIQTVVDAVKDVDAVIHLAAIVGDPASALDPEETIEINYLGTKLLAEICKYSQINRFIFASTCSVYGASPTPDSKINEESKLNPVSLYAKMKLESENGILEIVDENFSPTILRMATLYGLSPRMRFDLVVNLLTAKALAEKEITIFGGEQWRPLLHVDDAAEAYIKCLEAPIQKIKGEVLNVGFNDENYKIIDVGKTIKKIIPATEMLINEDLADRRDYNVSFKKIMTLFNLKSKHNIKSGIIEIKESIEKGNFQNYSDAKYSNYKSLKNYYGFE